MQNSVKEYDKILLITVSMLVMIGVIMVFSSSAIIAGEKFNDIYFFVFRQLLWVIIGIVALMVGLKINYQIWAKLSTPFLFIIIILLLMVLISSIGHSVGGARRWLRFRGIGFQPSELAEIVIVIFAASVLNKKFSKDKVLSKKLIPSAILVIFSVLLIYKQPDFGTSVIILLVIAGMLFIGGINIKYLFIGLVAGIPAVLYAVFAYGYRKQRVLSFLNPFEDAHGAGFQLIQSITAIGDGGFWGTGLGEGIHKLFFIPEVHTDFIYAIIGQELGFIGTMGVLFLFAVFSWRGIRTAFKSDNYLAYMMAGGLTLLISISAIINIGVVTGCLPTKGLPLPFVSFGGSSLIFNMFAAGIILNISKEITSSKKERLMRIK